MRYLTFCTDYDGTIAHDGRVPARTIAALEALRESGRRLILVSGRELEDLARVFDRFDLFERMVLENGALIYRPDTREERLLGEAPPPGFVAALHKRGVERISVGRRIVATWEPYQSVVLDTIREMGLELQVIFNKGAVMVLPAGINKAAGLQSTLDELNLSIHNTVGVGDAENDHAFLRICECSAAVANALPAVKEKVDVVLKADHGDGVVELAKEMLANDLFDREAVLRRHTVLLGKDAQDEEVRLPSHRLSTLIVGTSGGGKSTVAVGLVERLHALGYNFCVVDPEGDYDNIEGAVVLGSGDRAPSVDECIQLLDKPGENAVVNLLALKHGDRPGFFMSLLSRLRELRTRTGRPHCVIVDEAHHVMPASWQPSEGGLPERAEGVILVTVTPNLVFPGALRAMDSVVVLGDKVTSMLREFAEAKGIEPPGDAPASVPEGTALLWDTTSDRDPQQVVLAPTHTERRRHLRKYAEGSMEEERCFYFRGPEGKLRLRANNLMLFLDLADGVDDETWLFHLRRGEISEWLRRGVKDDSLADKVAEVEQDDRVDAAESRKRVRKVIEETYTLPAQAGD